MTNNEIAEKIGKKVYYTMVTNSANLPNELQWVNLPEGLRQMWINAALAGVVEGITLVRENQSVLNTVPDEPLHIV